MKHRIVWPIACIIVAVTLLFVGLGEEGLLRYGFYVAVGVGLVTGIVVRFSKRWENS